MKRGAEWLSRSVEALARKQEEGGRPPCFDVVVIGSGYGGAVAAARLSALANADGRPLTVCVLERGQEYPPGSFPAGMSEAVGHQRVSGAAPIGGQTLPEGLMDWHVGGDVWGLVANGLGGGSLINAGVCAPAQDVVLDRAGWPDPWRGNRTRWQGLYRRATDALGAQPWPRRRVPKQDAMERVARDTGGTCVPVSLTIAPPGSDPVPGSAEAAPEQPCIECGDCFTGCNVGAKRTLSHTYLSRAYRQGAELYCGATIRSVAPLRRSGPDGPRWEVHYLFTDPLLLPGRSETFVVHACHVVLAAGTFGSTEILMRSRSPDFEVSGRLGEGFSANGDILAAFYDTGAEVRPSPEETEPLAQRRAGPTITSQIEWPPEPGAGDTAGDVMQDLSVPGALGWLFREAVTTMMVPQRWARLALRTQRCGDRDIYAVDEKAVRNTLLTVSYADDGAAGRLEPGPGWGGALRDGSVVVRWKRPAQGDWFRQADARLAGRVPRGSFLLRNPLAQFMPKADYLGIGQTSSRLLTVHPLGGCRMGESADKGVVDPYGRVYDAGIDLADRGTPSTEQLRSKHEQRVAHALHEGLHVLDGSIVPTALGINPLLTITALAEGAIDEWVLQYGWTPVVPGARAAHALPRMPSKPAHVVPPSPTTVRFGEGMTGKLGQCQPPAESGTEVRVTMNVRFQRIADLREFLQRPDKNAALEADFAVVLRHVGNPTTLVPRDSPLSPVLASLKGKVQWLAVERSSVFQRFWRSLTTYLRHRHAADAAARKAASRAGRPSTRISVFELLRAGTHFGAVRQLAYEFEELETPWAMVRDAGLGELTLPAGTVLFGTKRLGYLQPDGSDMESANPWHQLANLALNARLPNGRTIALGTLEFDEMAMLDRYDMPLAIIDQSDMLSGMRDLASLALYFGRMMFGLHMPSFRRADYPSEERGRRELMRLPPLSYAPGRGYETLSITAFDVPQRLPGGEVIRLRLTRLCRGDGAAPGLPVLLLHGFGSGGIQFTHPAIGTPLGPWLASAHGHDVWVGELRTSIGLPTSARQWVMDDVAREDVPRLVEAVCERTGSERLQVIAHCIGSAMFSMAALAGRLQHEGSSRIASAVLMQVGPCAVLPRSSRARSHVALRLQQLFGAPKVGSVASQDPGDLESMLDRVLGTFLYPKNQRAYYRLRGDHDMNIRRTNANRSAGIFGQLFQYENMSPDVLDVMEDLLGDCNLTTYAQTADYAFGGRLADQRGDDAYVTDARLVEFFSFPVLFVHGCENQTFDPRTYVRNTGLVRRLNLKFKDHRVEGHPVKGYGHLDCVVGRGVEKNVFGPVADHLALTRHCKEAPRREDPPVRAAPAAVPCRPRLASIGPWIGAATVDAAGTLHLRVGLRIDDLGKSFQGVFAAAGPDGPPQRLSPEGWMPLRQECIVDLALEPATLAPHVSPDDASPAPLEVLVSPLHDASPADGADFRARVNDKFRRLQQEAVRRGVPIAAVPGLVLDAQWLRRQCQPEPRDLGLVLGACRQRPMLVDREMADRSMKHIHDQLDGRTAAPHGHAPIDALLLAGDQIYGDSRVDATHPGSSGGRYFDAYREAWTAPSQREVMRRRPIYMVTDDHEFRNDYNDRIATGRPREFAAAREAWNAYQLAAGPARAMPGDPTADWRHIRLRGFAAFLTDTRSGRSDVESVARGEAAIMRPAQMQALKDWLLDLQRDDSYGARAKIVVTASPVAPLLAEAGGGWSSLRGDGWQRFPGSLAELLGWIGRNEIGNVLFLSGDYHRHARCSLRIQADGKELVTATSIVTGGLYAPYPFANATRDEWLQPGPLELSLPKCPGVRWSYTIDADAPGDGYTRLTLRDTGALACDWVAMSQTVAASPDADISISRPRRAAGPA